MALTSCEPPVKDQLGRELPRVGEVGRLRGTADWLVQDKSAEKELISTRGIDIRTRPTEQAITEVLTKNAERLAREGRVIRATSGTKVRILEYCTPDLQPLSSQEKRAFHAEMVKVEILEGEWRGRTAFVTADAIEK
jgi:hypothetical protein